MLPLLHVNFFFSSRRRHTRWPRDWSSDVCSSDLAEAILDVLDGAEPARHMRGHSAAGDPSTEGDGAAASAVYPPPVADVSVPSAPLVAPSAPMAVSHTVADLRARLRTVSPDTRRAAVFTMGALHEGHLSLVRRARELAGHVTVTILDRKSVE